jgi:hypothetical protein
MLKVTYTRTIPPDMRQLVEKLLPKLLKYAPPWLTLLQFLWDPNGREYDGNQIRAWTDTYVSYREAAITLYPRFQLHSEASSRQCLLHELMHMQVAPLHDETLAIIFATTEEDSIERIYMLGRLDKVVEGMVEDLALTILSSLKEK